MGFPDLPDLPWFREPWDSPYIWLSVISLVLLLLMLIRWQVGHYKMVGSTTKTKQGKWLYLGWLSICVLIVLGLADLPYSKSIPFALWCVLNAFLAPKEVSYKKAFLYTGWVILSAIPLLAYAHWYT